MMVRPRLVHLNKFICLESSAPVTGWVSLNLCHSLKKKEDPYTVSASYLAHTPGILVLTFVKIAMLYGTIKTNHMTYQGRLFFMEGKIHIKKKDDLIKWLSQFPDPGHFDITVTPIGSGNNTNQSKLYHKWCDIIYKVYGWDSKAELHEYFKNTYNNGESTKNFDTKDWAEYMIKIQAFANENNINLPIGEADE